MTGRGVRMGGRLAVLAVVAASGCVVSVGDRPAAPEPPPAVPEAAPRTFATLRPGEFRPDHPALAAATPPPPTPPEPPPVPAPTIKPPDPPPGPTDSPVVTAVRNLEAGDPTASALPPGVLPLLSAAVRAARAGTGPAGTGEAVRLLEAAAAGLAPHAPLDVHKAVFCKTVNGFGLYDPLPADRPVFPAGRKPTAQVYLEFRNVAPRPDRDRFVWRPRVTWAVRDAAGAVVDQGADVLKREPTRSPTREEHVVVFFQTPHAPGAYTLTVGVAEPAADGRGVAREVSKSLGFDVR